MQRPNKIKVEGKKMDEFITELKGNINENNQFIAKHSIDVKTEKVDINVPNTKSGRIRTLLGYFANSRPDIEILAKCTEEGDVRFTVSMKSMGITYETLMKYKTEFCGSFIINFMGEMMIRENLELFSKSIFDLKDNYHSTVNKYEHKKFGMRIEKDKFVFIFHVSLLQAILTEDLKRGIN